MRYRRKAREAALQVLYALDVLERIDAKDALALFWTHYGAPEEVKPFATALVEGTWENRRSIDELIRGCSENWSLERMARVHKGILRMAVYEFLHCPDIPPKVTLNEAIDLGKIFGSENSGAFINGILDALYARLREQNLLADVPLPGPPAGGIDTP